MFDAYQTNNNRWGFKAEAPCKVPIDQKAGTRVTAKLSFSNPEDGFFVIFSPVHQGTPSCYFMLNIHLHYIYWFHFFPGGKQFFLFYI